MALDLLPNFNPFKKEKHLLQNYDTAEQSTDKSFSEALILASTNPQYDKRLFMELP